MEKTTHDIANILLESHGIDVLKYDAVFLDRSLSKRMSAMHCDSADSYIQLLRQHPRESNSLLNTLHNSYSEFFRNPLSFSVLEQILLPSLILQKKNTKRKEIRIWSAACAAGQETYSIAMLLEELIRNSADPIRYCIFATDQSESQVSKAIQGCYPETAFHHMSQKRMKQWCIKDGETYTIDPALKRNIDFSVFDLFDRHLSCPPASIFGDFDIVVCANLLFYYTPEYRKIILDKTGHSLRKEGYLITGETERDILIRNNYREVFPQTAIFQLPNMIAKL